MSLRKNGLFKILMVILFMAFVSGGCGGGSSGGSGGNSQGNNGGQSGGINGTWEIVSGRGITSADDSGRLIVSHYTCSQGMNSEVNLEMTQNNSSTYYGTNGGLYTLKMSGNNVIGSGGFGALRVKCTMYETGQTTSMNFPSGISFSYDNNGTYHMTGNTGANSYEYTLTLEDESTLRWTVYTKNNEATGFSGEKWQEIVLKRAGSNYDPNDYNGDNTNTNNNSNGDNNISPTPSPDNNTSQPDTPPQTNDTWEITSGSGLISQTISGKNYVSHLTYSPKKGDRGLEIDITQNDISTYYGEHVGMFSVTLTGDNVINSGVKGSGALRVSYSVAETPGSEASITFTGGKTFSYIGEGTYRMTTNSGEYDITLVDASTIKWKYTVFSEGWYEIVLTKQQ